MTPKAFRDVCFYLLGVVLRAYFLYFGADLFELHWSSHEDSLSLAIFWIFVGILATMDVLKAAAHVLWKRIKPRLIEAMRQEVARHDAGGS